METLPDPRNVVVTEVQLSDISDDVGTCWRVVGPKLLISASKIHNIDDEYKTNRDKANALLISWKQQAGSNATVCHLADVLESVGRRSIAERLLGLRSCECTDFITQRSVEVNVSNEPTQIKTWDMMICEMSDKLKANFTEVLRTNTEIKELKKELSTERKKRQEAEEKVLRTNTEIKELKEELSTERKKRQEAEEKVLRMGTRIEKLEKKSLVAQEKDWFDTKQEDKDLESREGCVKDQLENIKEQLSTHVTTPLQVPEINHDQPDTHKTLKLLTEKSTHLQDIYSETLRMVPEACKCSENLRNDFFDMACNGLRTGHYDIVHRVDGLESVQKEMSEEEKRAFKCLRGLQINRDREIEKLDLLWNCLLKAPECLPESSASSPSAADKSINDSKVRERHTNPGATLQKPKPREQAPNIVFTEKKSIFQSLNCFMGKNKNTECSVLSYTRRDS